MPRTSRAAVGGVVYHVLNRGNGRMDIFKKPDDYPAFLQILCDGKQRADVELFGFCLMSNHWHLVLRPKSDGDLAAYLSWVTNTHVKRYRAHYRRTSGHVYQGRYKSFPVEEDAYFLTLMRYVEANPVPAKMVLRAEQWRWSSLGRKSQWSSKLLDRWPVDRPRNWSALVNQPPRDAERQRVIDSMERGRPLGSDAWVMRTARKLGLQYTINPRGRPRKSTASAAK
jgi:putative transposase